MCNFWKILLEECKNKPQVRRTLANHIYDKELVSNIHKELSKCNKESNNNKKWQLIWKHTSPKKTFFVCVNRSVMSNSLRPHGLYPTRLLCPWNSPGKNTAVGCHSLLQGIFLTQGLNLGLQNCRQILYHMCHEKPSWHIDGKKYTKRCSASLFISEMQIKIRYHCTPLRMAKIERTGQTK